MSLAMRMARRQLLRRAPVGRVSMKASARSSAASKRTKSPAAAASRNSLRIPASSAARGAAAAIRRSAATARLLLRGRPALGAEEPCGLDELLDRGLILTTRLQQVNANRAADRN